MFIIIFKYLLFIVFDMN